MLQQLALTASLACQLCCASLYNGARQTANSHLAAQPDTLDNDDCCARPSQPVPARCGWTHIYLCSCTKHVSLPTPDTPIPRTCCHRQNTQHATAHRTITTRALLRTTKLTPSPTGAPEIGPARRRRYALHVKAHSCQVFFVDVHTACTPSPVGPHITCGLAHTYRCSCTTLRLTRQSPQLPGVLCRCPHRVHAQPNGCPQDVVRHAKGAAPHTSKPTAARYSL
jgi:hypothetical protein